MKINENYTKLKDSYLFKTIAQKTKEYKAAHPGCDIISMGIGDVTRPLPQVAVHAMEQAAAEMGQQETFHGYPDSYGEQFLLDAIAGHYRNHIGIQVDTGEIVVTCGAKEDVANILDIFSADNTVLIPDPVYPVYHDTNVMDGRRIRYMNANAANGFLPMPQDAGDTDADIIYLCSPNNPTGAAYTAEQLKAWVDYANSKGAVILYDAAYEIFVSSEKYPRSILGIEGARECSIEFCSFSKTAGFTGVRCGYTVVPKELVRGGIRLLDLWRRRQSTKFNGVSYIVQRGAAAIFTEKGYQQTLANISYYRENTKNMMKCFSELGWTYYGGENSPYVWLRCPGNLGSWEFFSLLLEQCQVVGTPGAGFGENGEGYFRLSGFGSHEKTEEALRRIRSLKF